MLKSVKCDKESVPQFSSATIQTENMLMDQPQKNDENSGSYK